jgi:hypothetical protein
VYRRYASLFFVTGIGQSDNELVTLEIIHRYVEVLDRYFGNVRNLSRCSPFSFDKVALLGLRARFVSFSYVGSVLVLIFARRIFNFQKAYAVSPPCVRVLALHSTDFSFFPCRFWMS